MAWKTALFEFFWVFIVFVSLACLSLPAWESLVEETFGPHEDWVITRPCVNEMTPKSASQVRSEPQCFFMWFHFRSSMNGTCWLEWRSLSLPTVVHLSRGRGHLWRTISIITDIPLRHFGSWVKGEGVMNPAVKHECSHPCLCRMLNVSCHTSNIVWWGHIRWGKSS